MNTYVNEAIMTKQQEQYFSASELSGLPGMPATPRGVLKAATRLNWPFKLRAARGGGREYPLSCLPREAQVAIAARDLRDLPSAAPAAPAPNRGETMARLYEARPESTKAEARERLAIVQEYFQLLARGFQRSAVVSAITAERSISEATLQRYLALVRDEPSHLWLYALAPRHVGRTAEAELNAEAFEFLKALYLAPERRTAKSCIVRLRRAAVEHGWTVPSTRTLERRLAKIPRDVRVLAREGKKAAQDLFPAQVRSRAALQALDIINGDGYLHNVFVAFPDGEIRRVKTWVWQDVHSSKILAWRTDKTEHTDVIRLSFGDVVEQYGIPEAALMDNTLAAANKTMSGGIRNRFRFKVKDEEPLGVFPMMGVRVMWATPGHGQAKPIERVFGVGGLGEYIDKAPELAGAWTGSSPLDKPDYDGKTRAVRLEELEAVIAREIAAFNAMEGRRSPVHQGRSFDAVFAESYGAATIRRATEAQRRLWLLATEPVRANARDGAITLQAGRITRTAYEPTYANRYWAREMNEYAGRMVTAKFDPKRLHEGVHVYALDGRYICFADCLEAKGFADQDAAREHQRNRKVFTRATRQLLEAERRMDALQASKYLPGVERAAAADLTIPEPKVVAAVFRDPLERPRAQSRELSADEREFMERLETEGAAGATAPRVNVHELRTDDKKEDYWRALDARRAAGETLAEIDEQFWKAWQQSSYHRFQAELDAEFEQRMAAGKQAAG